MKIREKIGRVALALVALGAALPSSASAGAIEGTVTEAGTGVPVGGLSVCAEENRVGGLSSGCTLTEGSGHYAIAGLPAGPGYQVEFTAQGGLLNYLTQYWEGKEGLGNWDPVAVADGVATEGIDAVMNPGAQIGGHIAEEGTGRSLADFEACVLDPAPDPRAEEFERCTRSDPTGNYIVRSLPAGTYVVVFARFKNELKPGAYEMEFYPGVSTMSEAARITVTPPEMRTSIDALLRNRNGPVKPLRCRKHFRKRRVKGKPRCVRVHRKHHRRHHGPVKKASVTG